MRLIGRPKIGLALGGGGARGLAHIGVIKTLEKHKIPIDYIAGTSAGALIGGIYAATKDIKQIEEIAETLTYKDFIQTFSDISLKSGLLRGEKVKNFIGRYAGEKTFKKLKIPFNAVTTDLVSGKTFAIKRGDIATAIRASCSLPGIFHPVKRGKKLLIDGGATEQVPVKTVKNMGAERIIAVNLNSRHFQPKIKDKKNNEISTISTLISTMNIMIYHVAERSVKGAHIVINPDVPDIPLTKVVNGTEYIKIGEKACEDQIDEIKWISKKSFLFLPVS